MCDGHSRGSAGGDRRRASEELPAGPVSSCSATTIPELIRGLQHRGFAIYAPRSSLSATRQQGQIPRRAGAKKAGVGPRAPGPDRARRGDLSSLRVLRPEERAIAAPQSPGEPRKLVPGHPPRMGPPGRRSWPSSSRPPAPCGPGRPGGRGPTGEILLEVVARSRREPEARFVDGEVILDRVPVANADIEYVVQRVGEFGDDNRAGIERPCIASARSATVPAPSWASPAVSAGR